MAKMVTNVTDIATRSVLISSAEWMEKNLADGTMQIGQDINTNSPCGMRVDVVIEKTGDDKPLIYVYTYSLDTLKFKEWLESEHILPLCNEGTFSFMYKGIQIVVPWGPKKWNKTAFSVDGKELGDKLFLDLVNDEVVFHVHRDLFAGKEWEVLLETEEEDDCPF